MPGHLPDDLSERAHPVRRFDGPLAGPFPGSHDLFADASILLVPIPGHAPGQMGAWVHDASGQRWLFAADGCWTRADLRRRPGPLHPLLAHDRAAQRRTYDELRQALEAGEAIVVPSHCPEAARELVAGGFMRGGTVLRS